RAITLVIDHALRHRRGHATVSVRAAAASDDVQVVINAQPSGFWPHAWESLRKATTGAGDPLRLRTARRIVDESGGAPPAPRRSGPARPRTPPPRPPAP